MSFFRALFIGIMVFFTLGPAVSAEGLKADESELVGTVSDRAPSWYAITKTGQGKRRLCTRGDIFYSGQDINNCLRIQEIRKEELILKDVNSEDTFTLKPGERIPLEGTDIIFEKTVETDIIEYRYKSSESSGKGHMRDFVVRGLDAGRIVLQRDYRKPVGQELFEDVNIANVRENTWSLDRESARRVFSEIENRLLSAVKKVRPDFRFGRGPSLRFSCALGEAVLDRQGFLVRHLAAARLLGPVGIEQGDLIKTVNGQPVNSLYGIYKAYMAVRSDSETKVVSLDIMRGGRPESLIYKIR